jgi:phosphoribosylformylglycinamidine cyclo-ligase
VVEAAELVDGSAVQPGHRILAVASSGVHSNGFSLVRRILEAQALDGSVTWPGSGSGSGSDGDSGSVIDALLTPTRIYWDLVKALKASAIPIHGMAHITGGGLPENLPRCLPAGMHAVIDPLSWQRPALFQWLQQAGQIPESDIWHTFNLGVGYCLVLPATAVDAALKVCQALGHHAWELGEVAAGSANGGAPLAGLPF